jgi:hypothetical protein
MKTSISDKIATILVWVLVHVVMGIVFLHIYGACTNVLTSTSVFIISSVLHYKWAYKMAGEVDEIFNS